MLSSNPTTSPGISDMYSVEMVSRALRARELGKTPTMVALQGVYGCGFSRKNNICVAQGRYLCSVGGNVVTMIDLETNTKRYISGRDGGGIGAIAVSPDGNHLAVAERAVQGELPPRVFVHNLPSLATVRILRAGTEQGYSDVSFSPDGMSVATVGDAPDFLLSVWQWEEEKVVLRTKAFSQEVFNVRFSQDDAGRLTTSGTGHIRFWRMARTFTGLKLQGLIGKFGKHDLSDVEAFAEMPDGKVLSGSEQGLLLLWDGGFIKCEVAHEDGRDAHSGPVRALVLDRRSGCFISGGDDGVLRWWPAAPIDAAEGGEDQPVVGLRPVLEVALPGARGADRDGAPSEGLGNDPPSIRCAVRLDIEHATKEMRTESAVGGGETNQHGGGHMDGEDEQEHEQGGPRAALGIIEPQVESLGVWLIQDGSGAIWKCDASGGGHLECLVRGHGGSIKGVALSAVGRFAASVSDDGSIAVQDYGTQQLIASARSQVSCSSVEWAPATLDASGSSFVVGHSDGTLHVATLGAGGRVIISQALKPHAAAITSMSFSPSAKMLATTGEDGIVFFLEAKTKDGGGIELLPRGFVTVTGAARGISWRGDGKMVLIACSWNEDRMAANRTSQASPRIGQSTSGAVGEQASGALDGPPSTAIVCVISIADTESIRGTDHSFELDLPVQPLALELPSLSIRVQVEEDQDEEDRLRKMLEKRKQDRLNNGEPDPEEAETVDSLRQDGSFRGEDGILYRMEERHQDPQQVLAAVFSPIPAEAVQTQRQLRGQEQAGAAVGMWPPGGVKIGHSTSTPAGRYGAPQARALIAVAGACSSELHEIMLPTPTSESGRSGLLPVVTVRALATYSGPYGPTAKLQASTDGKHLLQVGMDGVVAIRQVLVPSRFLSIEAAGADAGGAAAAKLVSNVGLGGGTPGSDRDMGAFLIVASTDGSLPVYRLRLRELNDAADRAAESGKDGPERRQRQLQAFVAADEAAMKAKGGTLGGASKVYATVAGLQVASEAKDAGGLAPSVAGTASTRPDMDMTAPASRIATAGDPIAGGDSTGGVGESKEDLEDSKQTADGIDRADAAADMPTNVDGAIVAAAVLRAALGADELATIEVDALGSGNFAALGPAEEDAPLPDAPVGDARDESVLHNTSAGYSLEQEKQHAEQDARLAAAELAKDGQRLRITALRERFASLRSRMGDARRKNARSVLPNRELRLDAQLSHLLEARGKRSIQLVERELAYPLTRARKILEASVGRYKVESAGISGRVHGLTRQDACVDPIQGFYIDPSMRGESVQNIGFRDTGSPVGGLSTVSGFGRGFPLTGGKHSSVAGRTVGVSQGAGRGHVGTSEDAPEELQGPFDVLLRGGKTIEEVRAEEQGEAEIANGFKARQQRRLARKAALRALLQMRPGPTDRDEAEDRELLSAVAAPGSMQLKENPTYKVPRAMRASASTKLTQLQQVIARMHDLRQAFNARVAFMRRLRARVVQAVALNDAECNRLTADIGGDPQAFCVLPRLFSVPDAQEALQHGGLHSGEMGLADDCFMQGVDCASSATWSSVSRLLHTAAPATALIRYRGLALPAFLPAAGARASDGVDKLATGASADPSLPPSVVGCLSQWPAAAASAMGAYVASTTWKEPAEPVAALRIPASIRIQSDGASSRVLRADPVVVRRDADGTADPQDQYVLEQVLIRMERRRTLLQDRSIRACTGLDAAIVQLQRERHVVQATIGLIALRVMTLRAELRLLQDMAQRDRALEDKLEKAELEREEAEAHVQRVQESLQSRSAELDAVSAKERQVVAQLTEALQGYPQEAQEALRKIFRRRVKRAAGGGGGDDAGESSSDEELDLKALEEMGEGEEEEEDEDAVDEQPADVPKQLFERVIELRARRAECESEGQELKKAVEELKGQVDRVLQKQKQVGKEVEGIEAELAAFQAEKQQRLNEIPVAIPLVFDQLAVGKNVAIPLLPPDDSLDQGAGRLADEILGIGEDQQNVTTFSSRVGALAGAASTVTGTASVSATAGDRTPVHPGIRSADAAIREVMGDAESGLRGDMSGGGDSGLNGSDSYSLPEGMLPAFLHSEAVLATRASLGEQRQIAMLRRAETVLQVRRHVNLQSSKVTLRRDTRAAEREAQALDKRAVELQELKFGRRVSLDTLDRGDRASELQRAEAQIGGMEAVHSLHGSGVQAKIQLAKQQLLELTRANTSALQGVHQLVSRQSELEVALNQGGVGAQGMRADEQREAAAGAERERLRVLVQQQRQQMEHLRQQIAVLRRKSRHLYDAAADAGTGAGAGIAMSCSGGGRARTAGSTQAVMAARGEARLDGLRRGGTGGLESKEVDDRVPGDSGFGGLTGKHV